MVDVTVARKKGRGLCRAVVFSQTFFFHEELVRLAGHRSCNAVGYFLP